jgi:hypothetical protein
LPYEPTTAEERALLFVLRLVDNVVSPGTLSPVERAFMAGAKVMFDHLSMECDRMLERKVSDLTGPMPMVGEVPLLPASAVAKETQRTSQGSGRASRKKSKPSRNAKQTREPKA